jgi:hypothetical protein
MMERISFVWSFVWLMGIVLVYAYGYTTPAVPEHSSVATYVGASGCQSTAYAAAGADGCASSRRVWAD